ncbi:MAG: pyridoxal phosphate-dependent aminotransferase [Clostridiales bacterium]|jgi:aspartate aminotransferase|nr:pyridoxal phosphate-dependent aminotransferase [Clostridiales bacterium]
MFSEKVVANLASASLVRAMFEQGERLRKQYGPENVYDFTLGNPDPEPPQSVLDTIKELASGRYPGIHKYMPNAGYEDVRKKVAEYIKEKTGLPVESGHVLMVSGAAGGLNAALKALLNPGEEVIVNTPFFLEYASYIDNFEGVTVKIPTLPETFQLDPDGIEKALTPKTKAIIINSPNNPSGAVYSQSSLEKLSGILKNWEAKTGNIVYVLSDEPYSKLLYDGVKLPSVLNIFDNSILIYSFSKSLSLPGERIGYTVLNPAIKDSDILMDAMIFCNRVLGHVNAPSLFQKVIAEHLDESVNVEEYKAKRDALYSIITGAGFSCHKPEGAFYLFPKSPVPDEAEFAKAALEENIIVVAGSGFGTPGYFRLAYCVSMETILNSRKGFMKLGNKYFGG